MARLMGFSRRHWTLRHQCVQTSYLGRQYDDVKNMVTVVSVL